LSEDEQPTAREEKSACVRCKSPQNALRHRWLVARKGVEGPQQEYAASIERDFKVRHAIT
jgi:hypothetical protein